MPQPLVKQTITSVATNTARDIPNLSYKTPLVSLETCLEMSQTLSEKHQLLLVLNSSLFLDSSCLHVI